MSRDIVEALNAHYGEPLPMGTGSPDAWSELIATWIEPVIREREADAWREGWLAMGQEHMKQRNDPHYPIGRDVTNPYEQPE